jgi:recombination protein RecA
MAQAALGLKRAVDLAQPKVAGDPWSLVSLQGRLTELVGSADSANISAAARLILSCQQSGALAAWIATHRDVFFPPDLAAAGVDLAALPVIWAIEKEMATEPGGQGNTSTAGKQSARSRGTISADRAARSAERLIRTGAVGIVIIDLARTLVISPAAQGRLLRLAEQHRTQVLILRRAREDDNYSGSLVSVRGQSSRERLGPGRFRCTITNTKDKREGPGWTMSEEFSGPPGLY